jgi:hypothetical protein
MVIYEKREELERAEACIGAVNNETPTFRV